MLLPGNAGTGGILSERDREKFKEKDISLSPGPKEKIYIQKFYLYTALTKPTELLSLSWSKVSGEGKSLRPAYLIQELRRLFPNLSVVDEENRKLSDREITRRGGSRKWQKGICSRRLGLDNEWKSCIHGFKKTEEIKKRSKVF